MLLARVDGNAVATVSHPSLDGWRLLLCQRLGEGGAEEGEPFLALDGLGAGLHSRVLVSTDGRAARELVGDPKSPARQFVVAVVDEEVPGEKGKWK